LSDQSKVLKFKKRKNMSIGVVVFLILFLYIAIKVGIYLTKDQLTIYEVQEGTTAIDDNRITGLILRQEQLINSSGEGYVTSYQKDCARIAKDTPLFSINNTIAYPSNNNKDSSNEWTQRDIAQIKHEIKGYINNYSDNNFGTVYTFQDDIKSTIIDIQNNNLVIESGHASGDGSALNNAVNSSISGIVTYYKDNFETISPENVTTDMFNKDNYKKTNLRTTNKIKENTPVCKMINSEIWNLVLPLTKEQYKKLNNKKSISITVLEDGLTLTPSLKLETKGSAYYGILTLNNNMSNYIAERYLDVELYFDSVNGLKIPISSLIDKEFYEVPKNFFIQGGDSKQNGLTKVEYDNGDINYPFVPADIYYEDDNYAYIDSQLFNPGTKIQAPGKNEQYTLSKTKELKGVYNVNQGYAVFKRVEILYQNDEYCIVKKDTKYGLSAYDHIALDSKMAVEQKIIY